MGWLQVDGVSIGCLEGTGVDGPVGLATLGASGQSAQSAVRIPNAVRDAVKVTKPRSEPE